MRSFIPPDAFEAENEFGFRKEAKGKSEKRSPIRDSRFGEFKYIKGSLSRSGEVPRRPLT